MRKFLEYKVYRSSLIAIHVKHSDRWFMGVYPLFGVRYGPWRICRKATLPYRFFKKVLEDAKVIDKDIPEGYSRANPINRRTQSGTAKSPPYKYVSGRTALQKGGKPP